MKTLSVYILIILSFSKGCFNSKEKIEPITPKANFSYTFGENGEVIFSNKTLNATTYLWDFGDGKQSNVENPNHFFQENKVYIVKLVATSIDNLTSEFKSEITIKTIKPIADFSYEIDKNGIVNFKNLSQSSDSFIWDFGDSTTSMESNPNHQFFLNSTYKIKLTSKNNFGSIQIVKEISINTSNTLMNREEVRNWYTNTNGFGKRGNIAYEVNSKLGNTYPSQLPPFYNIKTKSLYLSYWAINDEEKLFIFVPVAKIEKNAFDSFLNTNLTFKESRFLMYNSQEQGELVETEGNWKLNKLEKNNLTGTYSGKFTSVKDKKSYVIKFDFKDIYIPFVEENPI